MVSETVENRQDRKASGWKDKTKCFRLEISVRNANIKNKNKLAMEKRAV